ncbi:10717_t:CDS:2, partial [Acaulospora colombiana]
TNDQLGISSIGKVYGFVNMYEDLNSENVMHVERGLGDLEDKAAKVHANIINESQEKDQVALSRKDLEDLRKRFGIERSVFEDVPHPPATVERVRKTNNPPHIEPGEMDRIKLFEYHLNVSGFQRDPDDKFTFPFVKITSATVHLVNSLILNQAKSDTVLTFYSLSYLYKTIVKYPKQDIGVVDQDFTGLKKKLFMELNRTHEEDLNLRTNISASTCDWKVY